MAPVWPSLGGRNTVSVRGGSAHGPQAGGSGRLRVSTRRIGYTGSRALHSRSGLGSMSKGRACPRRSCRTRAGRRAGLRGSPAVAVRSPVPSARDTLT